MTTDQIILFALLAAVFALLIWGRWRYDVVAFAALLVAVVLGVVPSYEAFVGFGHPAVVIIALVLVVSRGLMNSGAVDAISRLATSAGRSLFAHISIMSGIAAAMSAVMNNVGALALLMPVELQAAAKAKRSAALTLMPLSFATILGGLVTLIGTPPNIIIAQYRADALGEPFAMFDYAPVGIGCALAGVLFVALIGWRLIPSREAATPDHAHFRIEEYIVELAIPEGSPVIGKTVREIDETADENDAAIIGLIRDSMRLTGVAFRYTALAAGDTLVLRASPAAIDRLATTFRLDMTGGRPSLNASQGGSELLEVVVPREARIEGRSARQLRLTYRHGVFLLGVSRQGALIRERVGRLKVEAGDILLLMGPSDRLSAVSSWLGVLPLAERGLTVTRYRTAGYAVAVFAIAIALASFGLISLPIALGAVLLAYGVADIIPLRQLYEQIEWPVIVLLGSLIPIGMALERSGGTELIADGLLAVTADYGPAVVLAVLMIVTMTLSDVLNNTATAVIAAPIALTAAQRLDVDPDPFLMAVAVGSSCAFLTPIGHKNNTLIMGPGGYRFGDYWPLGLPLEILIVCVGVPLILVFWPF